MDATVRCAEHTVWIVLFIRHSNVSVLWASAYERNMNLHALHTVDGTFTYPLPIPIHLHFIIALRLTRYGYTLAQRHCTIQQLYNNR